MNIHIKIEQVIETQCIACLKSDVLLFGESEIKPGILSTYNEIVKDEINNLESPFSICELCAKMLDTINEFKRKCLDSLLKLKAASFVQKNEMKIDSLCDVLIKEEVEEDIFAEELPLQESDTSIVKPERPPRSKKRKKKVGTQLISLEKKDLWTEFPAGFCHLCCYTHPHSHKHAIECHSKVLDDNSLRCLLCEEDFTHVYALLNHLEQRHKEFDTPQKCLYCDMTTKIRDDFIKHSLTHMQNKPRSYYCEFCQTIFTTAINLKFHHQVHFGALKCNKCCRSFYDKEEYDEHEKSHKKREKQRFICDLCGHVTKRKTTLLNHMIMKHHSTPELKYKCPQCDASFKTKDQQRSHELLNHRQKSMCTMCGKSFLLGRNMNRHVRKMHSELPRPKPEKPKTRDYACDKCDMRFFVPQSLKKHQYTHSKTRPFQCHLCTTGYYNNEYLRKHYLRDHSLNYTAKDIRKIVGKRYYEDSD